MKYSLEMELGSKFGKDQLAGSYIRNIIPILFKNFDLKPGCLVCEEKFLDEEDEEEDLLYLDDDTEQKIIERLNARIADMKKDEKKLEIKEGISSKDYNVKISKDKFEFEIIFPAEENDNFVIKVFEISEEQKYVPIANYTIRVGKLGIEFESFSFAAEQNDKIYLLGYASTKFDKYSTRKVNIDVYDSEAKEYINSVLAEKSRLTYAELLPKLGIFPDDEYEFELGYKCFGELFSEFIRNYDGIINSLEKGTQILNIADLDGQNELLAIKKLG